mmetsp:Transcript_21151/g.30216  ORF Transcript_21151/g.30216 Transcript_21151/m.30216 type:complete len:84 (+) Transcript_21151:96-347(+)
MFNRRHYFLGRNPCYIQCPNCYHQIVTRTKEEVSGCTLISMATLCVCYWPIFWLPICFPCCHNTAHYCPRCGYEVGKKRNAFC